MCVYVGGGLLGWDVYGWQTRCFCLGPILPSSCSTRTPKPCPKPCTTTTAQTPLVGDLNPEPRPARAGRIEVSAQNHNFAVDPATLPPEVEVTHINLNDGTCAGGWGWAGLPRGAHGPPGGSVVWLRVQGVSPPPSGRPLGPCSRISCRVMFARWEGSRLGCGNSSFGRPARTRWVQVGRDNSCAACQATDWLRAEPRALPPSSSFRCAVYRRHGVPGHEGHDHPVPPRGIARAARRRRVL